MKREKGMGHLTLIICIILIILIIVSAVYFFYTILQKQIVETYKTDMLLIQGKIKVLSEEAIINEQEDLLVGRKLTDSMEDIEVKELLEKGICTTEEEEFEQYYLLEKSNLEELGLGAIRLEKGYYMVNYSTGEVLYTKGIKVGNTTYYKLSGLEQLNKEENNVVEEEI